jgi:hypothetical protein
VPEGDVEKVPEIVGVPGIARVGGNCPAIRCDGDLVVTEQRLSERKRCPPTVVLGAMYQYATSAKRGPPRVSFHEKLGKLRVREHRFVRALASHAREPVEEWEGIVRVDRAGERRLYLAT